MEIATDTDDIFGYTEPLTLGRCHTPAHSRKPFKTMTEANMNVRMETLLKANTMDKRSDITVEKALQQVRATLESEATTVQEKISAIEELERQVEQLKRWKSFYSKTKTDMLQHSNVVNSHVVHVQAMSSENSAHEQSQGSEARRSQRLKQKQQQESNSQNIYAEYDAHYEAHQQAKKRVRFEEQLVRYEGEHTAERKERGKYAGQTTRKAKLDQGSRSNTCQFAEKDSGSTTSSRQTDMVGQTDTIGQTHNLTAGPRSETSMPLGSTTSSSIPDHDSSNNAHQLVKQSSGTATSPGQTDMVAQAHNLTGETLLEPSIPLGSTTSTSIHEHDAPNNAHQFAKQSSGLTTSSGQPDMVGQAHNLTGELRSESSMPLGSTISSSNAESGAMPQSQLVQNPTRNMSEKEKKRSEKNLAEAQRRGLTQDKKADKPPPEEHDMYKENTFMHESKNGIKVYHENQFVESKLIDDVSDYTLATFLMERKVKL